MDILFDKKTSEGGRIRGKLSSAEILTLNTAPVDVIPAPGAGKTIAVVSCTVFLDFNAIAYTTNVELNLRYGGGGVIIHSESDTLAHFEDRMEHYVITVPITDPASSVNSPITFQVTTGNPASGDSPLFFEIEYIILPFV